MESKIIDFDKSLRLTKITLMLSGIKISNDNGVFLNKHIYILFYINLLWLYTDVFAEFYWLIEGIVIGKSFSELTLTAPCTTICLLATAKSAPLFYNRDLLVLIFDELRAMHPENSDGNSNKDKETDDFDEEQFAVTNYDMRVEISKKIDKKIVKDSTKFLNMVILLLSVSCVVVTIAFSLLPLVSMAYEFYKQGDFKLQLPFLVKYLFDPYTPTMWPIMYFHQVYSTFIAAVNVFSADTLLYVFCTCIHMHFRILCHHLENVISRSNDETRAKLVVLARKHQKLIHLVNEMEVIYSKSILFNVVSSSLLICLSGFNVTFLDDMGAVFAFLTFLVMSVAQISLLCLFGDMLKRSSTMVSDAVYRCRWYDADQSIKKSMLLILMRAQKPCKLTAAKFTDLNLEAFTRILSRSWSYFALLKTMYN